MKLNYSEQIAAIAIREKFHAMHGTYSLLDTRRYVGHENDMQSLHIVLQDAWLAYREPEKNATFAIRLDEAMANTDSEVESAIRAIFERYETDLVTRRCDNAQRIAVIASAAYAR